MVEATKAVPIWEINGEQIGSAEILFNHDDGEVTMRVLSSAETVAGKECFFVVKTNSDGLPTCVYAFQVGDYHLAGLQEYPVPGIPKCPQALWACGHLARGNCRSSKEAYTN